MTRGSEGSSYKPDPDIEDRLLTWRILCARGLKVADIAKALDIPPGTLTRSVQRARRRGHPNAVVHPLAVAPGAGLDHLLNPSRARRRQREREQRGADRQTRGTLPEDRT